MDSSKAVSAAAASIMENDPARLSTVSLETALSAASVLVGDRSNTEYLRGMCELLEVCFPDEAMDDPTVRVERLTTEVLRRAAAA